MLTDEITTLKLTWMTKDDGSWGMLKAQLVRSGAQVKGSGELINACLVLFLASQSKEMVMSGGCLHFIGLLSNIRMP